MSMNKEQGFSMLEVLVAMVVIMVGALGIAGMQLLAITSTENARYQNVATMLAGSLTAAMQANVAYWGTPPPKIVVDGTTITGGPATTAKTCIGLTVVCDKTEMAFYDLKTWVGEVAAALPGSSTLIVCPGSKSPAICSVTLTWSERNVALHNEDDTVDGDLATGRIKKHTYQTLVTIL